MRMRMWTYDLAREQAPSIGHLRDLLQMTREAGYTHFGLYMEHRFAYPSTPWAHGKGALTPEVIRQLITEFPEVEIVPFVNLLGHYEGMLYTEGGYRMREERFKGLQACPSCDDFISVCEGIIDDVLAIFPAQLVHIGGDETAQLGRCPKCAARVTEEEKVEGVDGKAVLYGKHFQRLCQKVVDAGRTPGLWADMFAEHPQAIQFIPKSTILFDWKYFHSPKESARQHMENGFKVVLSPTLHTYNSVWLHLAQSERNVLGAIQGAQELGAEGVCVTTWECGLFGNYETLMPALRASGEAMSRPQPASIGGPEEYLTSPMPYPSGDLGCFLEGYQAEGELAGEWARLMGLELNELGGVFGYSHTRSSLKCRLLLYGNPFLAWLHHADELKGPQGEKALAICDRAETFAPNPSMRGVATFVKKAVEFVRYAEQARQAYGQGIVGLAMASLAPCRQIFEDLEKVAIANQTNTGGSLADIERCKVAKLHVETVMRRLKEYGDGLLGYLPAFEIITHPKFMPHDQASWWLINTWANE